MRSLHIDFKPATSDAKWTYRGEEEYEIAYTNVLKRMLWRSKEYLTTEFHIATNFCKRCLFSVRSTRLKAL